MATYFYNSKAISKTNSIEKNMHKCLLSEYKNISKHIDTNKFIKVLSVANYTKSIETTLHILHDFNYNINTKQNFDLITPHFVSCIKTDLLKFNKKVLKTKSNNYEYLSNVTSYTNAHNNLPHINQDEILHSLDTLTNYISNATISAKIILLAQQELLKPNKNKIKIEPEVDVFIETYLHKNLQLEKLLESFDKTEHNSIIANYKK